LEAPENYGLPSSIQTEVTVLGAMILDAVAITDATAKLQAEDFSLDSHQRVYRAIVDLVAQGHAVDFIIVLNALAKKKELDAIGGQDYLAFLTEGIPRNPNIESYVRIVKDKSVLRQLMSVCNDGMIAASDQSEDASDVLANIETRLAEVAQRALTGGFVTPGEIMEEQSSIDEFLAGGNKLGTIATGYAIDRWTNNFKPDQLIIIAARPSMGKTAWALNIAANSAIRFRKHVGIFTLEMSKEAILRRMIQSEARVPKHRFVSGLNSDEKRKAIQALESLMDSGLHIDEKAFTTMQEIRAKARRLKQRDELDVLIIDYLGLIEPPARSENRTQEVSAMSRGLKGLAKELGIPVIALAQLNRKCEERSDKRPMLSDLRDSGSIEQDADIVAFIYREEVYEPEKSEVRGMAEILLAKHRDGRIGRLKMVYGGDTTRFEDEAYPSEENYHG
jgi:replicative DNA helicase